MTNYTVSISIDDEKVFFHYYFTSRTKAEKFYKDNIAVFYDMKKVDDGWVVILVQTDEGI